MVRHPQHQILGVMTDFTLSAATVAPAIIQWQRVHGRNQLPWQNSRDPYRVWLSEIMLQQTQVATVLPYYDKFLEAFPNVQSLAQASLDEVLAHWAGLGYYSRARNLHACARTVMEQWSGQFPDSSQALESLPGIGRSTAAAIAAFCFGERAAILDGNVRRVFCRFFEIEGDPGLGSTQKALWQVAQHALPDTDQIASEPDSMQRYTQGLMDLGATICTRSRPDCKSCPIKPGCRALATGRVASLPNPRARRSRPERATHLLLLVRQGRVLLARRPDKGIWASMWSLPASDSKEALLQTWSSLLMHAESPLQKMAAFTHDLTHFRMLLNPWRVELPQSFDLSWFETNLDADYAWVDQDTIAKYGVPAPILPLVEASLSR